jgi:hypothetical protein
LRWTAGASSRGMTRILQPLMHITGRVSSFYVLVLQIDGLRSRCTTTGEPEIGNGTIRILVGSHLFLTMKPAKSPAALCQSRRGTAQWSSRSQRSKYTIWTIRVQWSSHGTSSALLEATSRSECPCLVARLSADSGVSDGLSSTHTDVG